MEMKLIDGGEPIRLWCDNKATLFTLNSETMSWKAPNLKTKFFYCNDLVNDGTFAPDHIDGESNPADIFTKALTRAPFHKHATTLGLRADVALKSRDEQSIYHLLVRFGRH